MASSSSPVSVFDERRFHKAQNQQLFESYARRRKVIPEVGFNLKEDEYPQIMEQIVLRGWRRLAAPRTNISKLLVQEFYANTAVSDEEAAVQDELPYKSFVRGQRDLSIPGATWKLSSSQPAVPIQLKRTELQPLARGWQEFIIHSLVTTGNKSEVTTTRAILIHSIMRGEDVRAEEIIADNMITIAQGLTNKGNLAHPSTIYKLCKDAGVPLREFTRTPRILELSYITAKRMEKIRFPRNQPQQQQEDEEEDEPMPQADGGNFEEEDQQPPQHGFPNFQPRYESQYHEDLQGIEETLSSMQFFQQIFYENMQKSQADYMEEVKQLKKKQEQIYNHNQRFHSQIWQEQEKLAKEIQEIQRSQLAQTMANNKRLEMEKNMQLALERQGRDIVEMRRQINLWTNNTSSKEAYACWAQQQTNPNSSEIPITQIQDIMCTNVEKGRPFFYGCLKSDYGASSSSQVDPEEPVPLRIAPPSPHFRPPHPPPN
ncbi:hypothetical protein PIB30_096201 [Stylosanthes scabra]|uniref:Putative plant transposon protein domain-containing protein n=1 Tax=Stylosanthes scabra TaxID=79078 RepID=A0ABU6WX25_9FABA|nr:hypothetical protein [Stylosanthes scabra]